MHKHAHAAFPLPIHAVKSRAPVAVVQHAALDGVHLRAVQQLVIHSERLFRGQHFIAAHGPLDAHVLFGVQHAHERAEDERRAHAQERHRGDARKGFARGQRVHHPGGEQNADIGPHTARERGRAQDQHAGFVHPPGHFRGAPESARRRLLCCLRHASSAPF